MKLTNSTETNPEIEKAERVRNFEKVKSKFIFKTYIGPEAKKIIDEMTLSYLSDLTERMLVNANSILSAYSTASEWVKLYHHDRTEYKRQMKIRGCHDLKRASKFLVEYLLLQMAKNRIELKDDSGFDFQKFYLMQVASEMTWSISNQSTQLAVLYPNSMTVTLSDDEKNYYESKIPDEDKQMFNQMDKDRDKYTRDENKHFKFLNSFNIAEIKRGEETLLGKFDDFFGKIFTAKEIDIVFDALTALSGDAVYNIGVKDLIEHLISVTKLKEERIEKVLNAFTLNVDDLLKVKAVTGDKRLDEVIHLLDESKQARITYSPILKLNIEDKLQYYYSGVMLVEAKNIFWRNIVYTEINNNFEEVSFKKEIGDLKNWATIGWFENAVADELRDCISDKAEVYKQNKLFGISTTQSGDYDVIVFSKDGSKIVILDCKLLKPRYMHKEFKSEKDAFSSESRYVKKLNDKIENLKKNFDRLKEGVRKELGIELQGDVQIFGVFVTAYPSVADSKSIPFRVIPAKNISTFVLCALKKW